MAGTRFLVAGLILFGILVWRRVPLPPRAMLGPIALTGMLLLFAANFLVKVAEMTVTSGMAAVIVANLPFVIVLLDVLSYDGDMLTALGGSGLFTDFARIQRDNS